MPVSIVKAVESVAEFFEADSRRISSEEPVPEAAESAKFVRINSRASVILGNACDKRSLPYLYKGAIDSSVHNRAQKKMRANNRNCSEIQNCMALYLQHDPFDLFQPLTHVEAKP